MDKNPEAPAPVGESVADNSTNSNQVLEAKSVQPQVDLHGFTSEQLADMRKFFDNNGGFDKVKSRLSNPEPKAEPVAQPEPVAKPEVKPEQPVYRAPEGSITAQEFLAKQYFAALSQEEKYSAISKEIAEGDVLNEMASFNIHPLNQDGSINDAMVRRYLDLKAQTVPARQSGAMPEASASPTVDYVPVENEKITDLNQAYAIIRQDAQLKGRGMAGHPNVKLAEDFIKNSYKDTK